MLAGNSHKQVDIDKARAAQLRAAIRISVAAKKE